MNKIDLYKGDCLKVKDKKELKQKIAESFANRNISHKSQYIRDLIEYNVNEDLAIVSNSDLKRIKDVIINIDRRQSNGYETFNNVKNNQDTMIKHINSTKVWIAILSVVHTICYVILTYLTFYAIK